MTPAACPDPPPASLGGHAADNLSFIRQAMERSATFTAVPGVGGGVMGAIALVAALVGSWQPTGDRWLLYGAGLLTGGIFSVPVVRLIGALFMGLGVLAILTPPDWGNIWLALGFGGLQIGFGGYIARNHGG